jgi:DNA repair exonuclease SbcCD ATPase subunit
MKLQKNRQIPLFSTINGDLSSEVQHIIIRRLSEELSPLTEELHKLADSPLEGEKPSKKEEAHNCLSSLRLHLPKLKNIQPDCSKYSTYIEIVKPHLEFANNCINEANSYKENLEGVMSKLTAMDERINKSVSTLEFLTKQNESTTPRQLKSLKLDYQNIGSRLNDLSSSFKKTIEEMDALNKRLQLCEDELKALMSPSHEWEEISTVFPYPTSKPDEFREVEKVVGRRCKRCGLEERY